MTAENKLGCVLTLAIAVLFVGTVIVMAAGGVNWQFSEGERSGVVYKISKKGWIWKTWEGSLNLGMMDTNDQGQLVPMVFAFSVSDEGIAHQVEEAARSGKRCTLHYKQYLLRGFAKGGTSYDVVRVENSR